MQNIEPSQNKSRYTFLAKNVFWLTLGRIVSVVLPLIALPIITTYLDPKAYGIIALFMVEASLLGSLYGLGLGVFASRMIYKYERSNKETCFQYLGVILFYLIVFSLIGLFISLPFVKTLKRLIFKDVLFPYPFLFYIPVIYGFFDSIHGFTTNSFLSLQQNKKYFICNITGVLLLIPLKVAGLVWFSFTWIEIVTLQLIVKIIIVLLSLWLIKENLSFSFKRLRIIKYALRYSLPYIPMYFCGWIQQQIDKIFLGRMHAVSYVGVYAVGLRVSEGYQFFSRPMATSVKPEISKRLDMRQKNINKDIGDFFTLFFQLSLFAIFSLSIFSKEIIDILTDVKYSPAFKIIPLAMLGYMCSELSGIFHLKVVYRNKSIFFTLFAFLGAFLNVSLNYVLIPRYGIVGAACATALANLIILFIWYVVSQKLHFTRYHMLKNFSVFILVTALIFLIQYLFPHSALMVSLKCVFIVCYAIILIKYLLRTNKRFLELKQLFAKRVSMFLSR